MHNRKYASADSVSIQRQIGELGQMLKMQSAICKRAIADGASLESMRMPLQSAKKMRDAIFDLVAEYNAALSNEIIKIADG